MKKAAGLYFLRNLAWTPYLTPEKFDAPSLENIHMCFKCMSRSVKICSIACDTETALAFDSFVPEMCGSGNLIRG